MSVREEKPQNSKKQETAIMERLKNLCAYITQYKLFSWVIILETAVMLLLIMSPTVVYTLDGSNMSLNTEDYEITIDDENAITIQGGGIEASVQNMLLYTRD